jgi:hypothetical protein
MGRAASIVIAVCAIVILWIGVAHLHQRPEPPSGASEAYPNGARGRLTPSAERELERIATLGYIAGVDPVPDKTGVLTHLPEDASVGLTLYTCAEDPTAFLIDMQGNVVHSWSSPGSKYWARARALPNGDLLVITCGPPQMLKLNRESEVIWRFDDHAHHDFAVLPDSTTCVLVRGTATRPYIQGGADVIDDNVVLLDAAGRELAFISLLKAFERSELGTQWLADHPLPDDPDIFHANSVEVLLREGRLHLLLSIRSINTVAILDVASGEIVWALSGRWHKQHEAQFVDGNLLLFDNLGLTRERSGPEQSRVIEVDVTSRELVWSFTEPGFFSRGAGAQQRLPNGNTLITESENGRILEVTRDGRTVWEYINPMKVRDQPGIILGILRAERIPASFASEWGAGTPSNRRTDSAEEPAAPDRRMDPTPVPAPPA